MTDRKYVTKEIVGFKLLRCPGAVRNGHASIRPEIRPTHLLTARQTLPEGRLLRDLGEQKWQGTKGSQDFHRSFLTILNYLVHQDNPGIKLYYESGTRRVEHAKRPVIVPNDTLARGPRTRLDALDNWMDDLQQHYGTPETYSPDQSQRIVNWVATIITRDPVMTRMLVES